MVAPVTHKSRRMTSGQRDQISGFGVEIILRSIFATYHVFHSAKAWRTDNERKIRSESRRIHAVKRVRP